MRQTTLSFVLEVEPASVDRLSKEIGRLRDDEETRETERYGHLKRGVPTLHFLSMSVFEGADYDPIFVIEANFDGRPGLFWAQLEATLANYLWPILRCCKPPLDKDGKLYDDVTKPDSRVPIAPYLERRTVKPSVFHHGNRGLERERILREGMLFHATRDELAQSNPTLPNPYRGMTAPQIHQSLRAALLGPFPWLGTPAPARIPAWERTLDVGRLLGFLLIVLIALSVPGFLFLVFLRAFLPDPVSIVLLLIVPLVAGIVLYATRSPRPGEAAPTKSGEFTLSMKNKMIVLVFLVVAMAVIGAADHALCQAVFSFLPAWAQHWWPMVGLSFVGIGIYTVFFFSIPVILVWLRWLERRDSHHDAPVADQGEMRKMTQSEDRIPQNHMGSVVLVKPGVLRKALVRTGHLGLHLSLRVLATDGYLGRMRTVHFAHWAFINNGSRLMFLSNFDNSWDSYLDDFLEKAHEGVTLAWGSGVGFPATRFLLLDGASHGRKFKAWARHSMAASRFWFSAYRDYTVDQIERHARIADGLRKATLTTEEAATWARDL